MNVKSKLPFFSLVLLIVSAVDSNRNLPSTAIFGAPLVFFFLFSAVFFLFPVSLVSAELGSSSARKGGIYHWVQLAFGERAGLVAIWLQWVQAITWFPTILTFLAATAAFLIDPSLIYSKTYVVVAIAGIFWTLTLVNLWGIQVSAKLNELFCAIGTMIPTIALVVLSAIWIIKKEPLAISVTPSSILPSFSQIGAWTALVAVMSSFSGMELAGVHIPSIEDPRKSFPRALMIGSSLVLLSMLFGALSIAFVLPTDAIHLAGGLMQVFTTLFQKFHMSSWVYVAASMVVLGSLASMINWIGSPAKGLLNAAKEGYLPHFFSHVNKRGVSSRILFTQAILVTLLCTLFLFLPSVNAFYWFLMTVSNCLYMSMYILMFLAALRLRSTLPKNTFRIPFGLFGLLSVCALGMIGCLVTIVVAFTPPPGIPIASPLKYAFMIAFCNLLLVSPVLYLFWYKKKKA